MANNESTISDQLEAAALAQAQATAEAEQAEREALDAALAATAQANAQAAPTILPFSDEVPAPKGTFGPTLILELQVAGLGAYPFVTTTDRVIFSPDITQEQRAAVLAVIEAHDPTAVLPPLPEDVPDISDRQFACGLWGDGIISYADFLGFIGPGTIPDPIQSIVDQLADDDTGTPTPRKMAVGFLTGSKLYSFGHPLVEFFRQALAKSDPKWTADYLRQQWLVWSAL